MSLSHPGGSDGNIATFYAGDLGSIPGLVRSLEEGMATHSIFLPGEFHGTEEPGWIQSMGLHRVRHD